MYSLVYEYHDRPMFPIPIVIHLWRTILFCYDKIWRPTKYGGAFGKYCTIYHEVEKNCNVMFVTYTFC